MLIAQKSTLTALGWIGTHLCCLLRQCTLFSLYWFHFFEVQFKTDSRCKICLHLRFLHAETFQNDSCCHFHLSRSLSLSPLCVFCSAAPVLMVPQLIPLHSPPLVLMKTLRVLARLHLPPPSPFTAASPRGVILDHWFLLWPLKPAEEECWRQGRNDR